MAVFTIGSKTLSGSPTGGAVGGASNLTTVGAIPYVSSSGVLNQDATKLFWDAANSRLGVGTASPMTKFNVVDTVTTSPRGILSSQYSTGTDGARVGFSKARGTEASPTTVVTGDTLGRMMFRGYDGSNFLEMGSIEIVSTGTIAATRVPTYMAFSTATNATPSVLTEAIRITESQQLLVGLTSATGTKALTVNGGIQMYGSSAVPRAFVGPPSWDASYVAIQNATMTEAAANAALFQDPGGNTTLNASNAGYLMFKRNNVEVARFAATTGNLLIGGTTDSGYRLGVQSSGTTGTVRIFDQTATTGSTLAVIQAGAGQSGNLLSVRNNAGTELAGVDGTGKYRSDWHTDLADTSMALRASALQMNSTYVFQWSSGGSYGNAKDIGLARSAAGILEINNGTVGTYRDLYTRSQILYGAGTGVKTLQVRGNSSNDAIIQEWQNNAGTTLASISSAGVAAFAGVSAGSLSTTGSALVGAAGLYYWTGRSAMSSSSDGIIAFTNNAGTNFDRLIFGVGNSSFPSLKRSGSVLEVRLADDSAYAALQAVRLQTAAQTVSQLPAAAAGNAGSIQYVTDANATTIGSTVAGGGANKVMVWSDGTNWKIYAS